MFLNDLSIFQHLFSINFVAHLQGVICFSKSQVCHWKQGKKIFDLTNK
jgi:hypothetical protein